MFCYQCQGTASNKGCKHKIGVCGKKEETAALMDVLLYNLKEISSLTEDLLNHKNSTVLVNSGRFITKSLFSTITNANYDDAILMKLIKEANSLKKEYKILLGKTTLDDDINFNDEDKNILLKKALKVGVLSTKNEDIRSLRELLIYGIKGFSAYVVHAANLGFEDDLIYDFVVKGLSSTLKDLNIDMMINLTMKCGEIDVKTMALLDKANTETYGNPEITKVNIGVNNNPGILISGHDLKDISELLKQTENTGIDIYTHSEMLPAHYYPAFKKYKHLIGNYGNAWWKQQIEFESFKGPILMTTNCIVPVKESYKERIFTTGTAGYPEVKHISENKNRKDFSEIISLAKTCPPPKELEKGEIIGGFAHNQVILLLDKIVDAVKSGAIKRFIVMAGCDGKQADRHYFTDVAKKLPKDTVILTAGCAKYRYNKIDLGEINGIPRVLDAGQCNDSYSLVVIALKLKEVFKLNNINQLPISFDIAWYEQKAVTILLALLYLGIQNIRIGPTLPAFLSVNVVKVLVKKFNLKLTSNPDTDIVSMLNGQ